MVFLSLSTTSFLHHQYNYGYWYVLYTTYICVRVCVCKYCNYRLRVCEQYHETHSYHFSIILPHNKYHSFTRLLNLCFYIAFVLVHASHTQIAYIYDVVNSSATTEPIHSHGDREKGREQRRALDIFNLID